MRLCFKGFELDFSKKTYVMGVLNTTPDSFSDGGLYADPESAVKRALQMTAEGADIIDVGGQSTRPGAEPVSIKEEIKRTAPIIKALSQTIKVPISIDTYNSEVATACLDAGASIINDISGLRFDPDMASTAAKAGVPVVIMHIKGTPKDMQKDPFYEALVPEVIEYLRKGIAIAQDAGIENIIIDPGIGFGKSFEHNLTIINRLREFTYLQKPLLIGVSRKAFLGRILGGLPPHDRVEGTIAAVTASVLNGANIVRVHDVKQAVRAVAVADSILRERIA